jgi:hypothetical protein
LFSALVLVMLPGRIAPMNDNTPTGGQWRRGLVRQVRAATALWRSA